MTYIAERERRPSKTDKPNGKDIEEEQVLPADDEYVVDFIEDEELVDVSMTYLMSRTSFITRHIGQDQKRSLWNHLGTLERGNTKRLRNGTGKKSECFGFKNEVGEKSRRSLPQKMTTTETMARWIQTKMIAAVMSLKEVIFSVFTCRGHSKKKERRSQWKKASKIK